jgi:hypothetical protein
MSVTMVTMTVVTIVIIARGSSSMVAVMIMRRKPIVAAIVSHALVTLWSTVVLASGDMPARTAVGVAAFRSTASSRSMTATGIVAAAFCNECQETRTRLQLVRGSTCVGRAVRKRWQCKSADHRGS